MLINFKPLNFNSLYLVHDLVHIDAIAVRQLLKIAISALKQAISWHYNSFLHDSHHCAIQSISFLFFFFSYDIKEILSGTVMYTYRVHEYFVLFILFRIQHVIALLTKSNAHESWTVIVRVVTCYLWHNYTKLIYFNWSICLIGIPWNIRWDRRQFERSQLTRK